MRFVADNDGLNRRVRIRGEISHVDLASALNDARLLESVMVGVSQAVVDRVMKKLGPAIDKALAETLKELEERR